jgi:hypothetical protein
MNLKAWNDVVSDALPSLRRETTQLMFWTLLVKGAAIEASASLKEMPTFAVLSAPQSLAPSPHIPIFWSRYESYRLETSRALSSGDIRANT